MPKKIKDAKHAKTAWKTISREQDKPWGHELVWSGHDFIHGKILYIKKGHKTSLKYHALKAETLFFLTGRAHVTYGSEHSFADPVLYPLKTEEFVAGDTLMVQSGCPYRIYAVEDCEVIEIGNHLSDKPVRIEDDYGRANAESKQK